jgi:WD40 repeat protein
MKISHTIKEAHLDKVESVKISPSGKEIISLGQDNTIKISDFYSQKTIAEIEHHELFLPSAACHFSISSNGKYLAVGSSNGSVLLFDMKARQVEEIYQEHQKAVLSCAWDSWSSKLASIDTAGNIFVWE